MASEVYAVDCGTTNWRIHRLSWTQEEGGGLRLLGEPQRVALTTFAGAQLPAALLLDPAGRERTCGANAYEEARDPDQRPGLRDAFKLCLGNQESVDPTDLRRRYMHAEALTYTQLLLEKVLQQLGREKPGSLGGETGFLFTHPVHWGREREDGSIEGDILPDFAAAVRASVPEQSRVGARCTLSPSPRRRC